MSFHGVENVHSKYATATIFAHLGLFVSNIGLSRNALPQAHAKGNANKVWQPSQMALSVLNLTGYTIHCLTAP
jgi:hypothetical protein